MTYRYLKNKLLQITAGCLLIVIFWVVVVLVFALGKNNLKNSLSSDAKRSQSARALSNPPRSAINHQSAPLITVDEIAQYNPKVKATLNAATRWFGNADPNAQNYIGWMYHWGKDGVSQNDQEAVQWYQKAAENGHMSALNSLAYFYELGKGGLPGDLTRAAVLYQIAAEGGDPYAQRNLGRFYQQGLGGLPKDPTLAKKWTNKATAQGLIN